MLKALWRYKGFILSSVKREFQMKYQNSLLGAAWLILNPLAMILVYTVIFSQVMHAKLVGADSDFAYSIYLCAGLLTWGLFSEIILRGLNIFIENANYLKKINFPRICLPIISVMNASINFSIIFTLFLAFLVLSFSWPGVSSIAIIPVLIIELVFALGLGMTLGIINIFFRDVGQFFTIFLQFWFWFTPIVYPVSILPEPLKGLVTLNPMYPIITAYQAILVYHHMPDWANLMYPAALGSTLCIIALNLFRKRGGEMVDEL